MTSQISQGFNGEAPVWYTHSGAQFRGETYADKCYGVRINHDGWFADSHQENKVRGLVARLTHGRFLAGYEVLDSGERVYFDGVFSNIIDAATWADNEAEHHAKREREHADKFDAAVALESKIEDAHARLRECLILRNHKCMVHLRREAAGLMVSIRESRDRLACEFAGVL